MHRGRVKLIFDSIFDVGLGDTIKRATLNVSIGRPVLLRPEDGTTKAKGRSPLPAQGYVPRVWPKSSICPTSPRLRRAVSLSSTLMAKKLDLQAGTEAKAFAFTDFDKPWGSRGECFTIDAFGHEKDTIHGDFGKFQE